MQDNAGRTALLYAVGAGHRDAVAALVKAGADAGIADQAGRLPLAVAEKMNRERIAKLLRPVAEPSAADAPASD